MLIPNNWLTAPVVLYVHEAGQQSLIARKFFMLFKV